MAHLAHLDREHDRDDGAKLGLAEEELDVGQAAAAAAAHGRRDEALAHEQDDDQPGDAEERTGHEEGHPEAEGLGDEPADQRREGAADELRGRHQAHGLTETVRGNDAGGEQPRGRHRPREQTLGGAQGEELADVADEAHRRDEEAGPEHRAGYHRLAAMIGQRAPDRSHDRHGQAAGQLIAPAQIVASAGSGTPSVWT